jgi:hypothetical protein
MLISRESCTVRRVGRLCCLAILLGGDILRRCRLLPIDDVEHAGTAKRRMTWAFQKRWLVSFSAGGFPRVLPTFAEEEAIDLTGPIFFSSIWFFFSRGC